MASCHLFFLILLSVFISTTFSSQSLARLPTSHGKSRFSVSDDDQLYCDSWRLAVETNSAGAWQDRPTRCEEFVKIYMNSTQYLSDTEMVANYSLAYASGVKMDRDGNGKDAWVFDIDDTLVRTFDQSCPKIGSETFDVPVDFPMGQPIIASLNLYNELKKMGFKSFLITGRPQSINKTTEGGLRSRGYEGWEKVIYRAPCDQNKDAILYKSEKRAELMHEGYTIHGSSGDQWSDLLGFAVAKSLLNCPTYVITLARQTFSRQSCSL